jgi:biotin synthase
MFMAYSHLFWNFLMSHSQVLEKPLIQAVSASAAKASVSEGDWTVAGVEALFALPFNDLLFRAQEVHRAYFPDGDVELATLLSIKTGGCPEDCGYCPQAARYNTDVKANKLMDLEEVLEAAKAAKAAGSNRFCMGAAWREPKDRDIEKVSAMIRGVKALGLEDFYRSVIKTRDYQDRLDTISHVRAAGMSVCCGGIVGMGESREQRAAFIARLANLSPYPESVPINHLVPVAGTPLADQPPMDPLEFVRTIAVARITMPKARVRLSAGRQELGRAVQAMCFQAGANSIFYGDQLLTTGNPEAEEDRTLLAELGLKTKQHMKAEVTV